ncbi:MAG: hypothetical protein J6K17_10280 [Oscillospiraceae bacterium]|nr:hypothetical protein [Oscillospiraceae bacterium]
MKELFKNFKIPIILGGCALLAVIITVILLTGGSSSSSYGLYMSSAYGTVSVTNSDNMVSANSGDQLNEGDVITVGDNSSCTLVYEGNKNSDDNYIVIGANSQIVVMNDFDGKDEGELFIRNGTVIANFADDDHSPVVLRTVDASITTEDSVSKVSYYTNEYMSYTDLYTFMGNNQVQLYDEQGHKVNNAEMQIEKKWGRVVAESGPSFEALNLDIDLNELSAFDLKALIKIANIVGDKFPYTVAELKAVYDTKSDDNSGISIEQQPDATETAPVTEPVNTPGDTSGTIQTAEPITTTVAPPTETTLPGQTTTAAKTTSAANTTSAQNTTTKTNVYHNVTIIIDGEETIQEVPHGGNAEKPEDPHIDGLTFIGWDNSFENITEDRIITAMFDEAFGDDNNIFNDNDNNNNNTSLPVHNVTVVIGDKSTVVQVVHGQSANLPSVLNIEGYVFMGWDKDYTSITEDMTITAILKPNVHTVTFIVENNTFTVEVEHGGDALPTYIPVSDSNGNMFVGWDKPITNITMDTTVKAVFNTGTYHTVTFIIDNEFYTVHVADGGTAEPPFWPMTNSLGVPFLCWDRSLDNITSDVTITAYYG